jgi:S1-C subfamily serine protease
MSAMSEHDSPTTPPWDLSGDHLPADPGDDGTATTGAPDDAAAERSADLGGDRGPEPSWIERPDPAPAGSDIATPEPETTADGDLGPPPLPDSEALIPPPPPLGDRGDVYRGDDYGDLPVGPASRPPRTAYESYAATLPAASIEPRAERVKPSKWSTMVLPFLAGAVGAALVVGAFVLFGDDEAAPAQAPSAATAAQTVIRETVRTEFIGPDGAVADATAVARKVIPSVVTVEVGVSDGNGGFNGTGSGSGVVLSTDGYIVTNEHVVDGSELVTVSFSDGRLYEAELLGADPVTDLALLKIDAQGLVPIDVGSTADLQIGDPAIAAGSPLGLAGGPTVTVGVISAFDREVQTGPAATDRLLGMLQTDAPITRGSSGGALVDSEGALIGVTSAVGVSDVGVEGIGFAIPIEVVQRITDELIANGEVTHSFLGIEGRTSFEEQFDGAEQAVGVFIQAIVEDSGAEAAGLEEGDVITSIEGAQVRTINSLVGRLRRYEVGQPLDVEITRGGRQLTLTIELGPRPDDV